MTVTTSRVCSWIVALVAGLCLMVGGASQADAHAVLTGSTPARGAVTAEPPSRVTLVFTEEIAVTSDALRVLDPQGRRVDDAHPVAEGGNTYAVALRGELPHGTYTVAYQGVSADSHPIAGAFTFSVGAPSATAVAPSLGTRDPDAGFVGRAYAAGRLGAYIGVILLIGAACLLLWCWPEGRENRLLRGALVAGWGTTVLCTLALLVLRSAYTGSGRVAETADVAQLGDALRTKTGALLGVRLALLAGCAALWARRGTSWPAGRRPSGALLGRAALTAAGLAGTWAGAEHASAGLQPLVAVPVDAVHLLAAGTWVGGLFVLALLLLRRTDLPAGALERFSQVAFVSVCVLVVTGLYQTWRQVGSPSALLETRFGLLLAAKAAVVAVLLCLGYLSRRLTRRIAQATPEGPGTPVRRLRRGVAAEAALGLCVIVVAAVLTSTEPARSEASAAVAASRPEGPVSIEIPFDTGGPQGAGTAAVILDPGRAGPNGVHVTLTDPADAPLDVPAVEVSLTSPSTRIGPLPVPLARVSEGHWTVAGFQVPMPGDWELTLTVRTSDIDQITVRRTVGLR
ncbi:copper resistance protein CopC [Streptomyces sp. NBC_00347]|uniref:copper resistance CopC/CopD family protein n=1 Tax=Streptomyces sp. NBC_00347 TaxID=2975721 RepID=UPI002255700D|nr:copper resistance protein CopC [Streptomyces sp. NBC_00347]MCX5130049.1 copper resistance protein CopC/CopD [Streptomyces sp. NBC_00347]